MSKDREAMPFPEKDATVIRNITRTWVLLLVGAAALVGPVGTSWAQTSAGTQYGGNLGGTAHGGTPGVRGGEAATLPFTGLTSAVSPAPGSY